VTYSKEFFGIGEDEPFNLAAAVDAYEWVMEHPQEAPFVVSKALFDNTTQLMEHNSGYIEQVSRAYVSKRIEEVTRGLSRSVSKSAQDARGIVELISKASQLTEWERSQEVKDQMRDARGRWRVMNRKIIHNSPRTPMTDDVAAATTGLRAHPTTLSPDRKAAYQHDYAQVVRALDDLRGTLGNSLADTYVQAAYTDGTVGQAQRAAQVLTDQASPQTDRGLVTESDYANDRRVERVIALSERNGDARTLSLDALTAMTGSPGFADFATGAGVAGVAGGGAFRDSWTDRQNRDQTSNTNRLWRRLEASSKLALDMGGKYLPPKAQLALHVGEWAGKYAPEAEKVIGPTARKSAYRYRGVEKKPWTGYQDEIDTLRQQKGSGRAAHDTLIHGYKDETGNSRRPEEGVREDRRPSRTIQHMRSLLPDPGLYELNRKSGTIPPSQGIIIDRKGEVVTEAMGYGDDWYLPFNLKNLSKLQGGEYIRTRAYGGLTTEDIYTGLVGGARSVTVVSHSGVFTMEFDDDFRGSRRYNDKAARMVGRYGQVLDAVKSEKVSLGSIPHDRRVELEMEAVKYGAKDSDRYRKALDDLIEKEPREPKLSEVATNKVKWDAINQHVIDNAKGNNVDEWAQRREIQIDRQGGDKAAFRARMANPDSAAEELAAIKDVERAVDKATRVYAESINPLRLNARGYATAMNALKEQFPYYIKDPVFTPWTDGLAADKTDRGYVKPRYIRPHSVATGYYDESITGRGKVHGDQINYQNWSSRKKSGDAPEPTADEFVDEEEQQTTVRVSSPSPDRTPAPVDPAQSRQSATLDLIRALRAQTVLSPMNTTGTQGAITDAFREADPVKAVLGGTEDEVRARLADPAGQREVEAALTFIKSKKMFDVDAGMWDRSPKVIPLPEDDMTLVNNLGVRDFAMSRIPSGETTAWYESVITPMLNKSVNPQVASLGITMDSTHAEVKAAVKDRAANLRGFLQAWDNYDKELISTQPSLSRKDIRREAEDLAAISTAFRLRQERADAEKAAADAEASRVIHTFSDEETKQALSGVVPKDDAPEEGAADEVDALKAAAAPYRNELASMVGMDEMVGQMDRLVARAAAAKRRERMGKPNADRPMSMIFAGNPGTGKTTVAEIMTKLYYDIGLTENTNFLKLSKKDLVGGTANDIAERTRNQLEMGKGGVIFIDEAYTLNSNEYGREVIDELVPFMSENPDTVFIFAGYPKEMQEFREETNPGLQSRLNTVIEFRDYTAPELVQIASHAMDKQGRTANAATKKRISNAVAQIHAHPKYNGNARDVVDTFLGKVADAHDERLLAHPQVTPEMEDEFTTSDVEYAVRAMGLKPPAVRRKKVA
jgi:stage V sporulation protein K